MNELSLYALFFFFGKKILIKLFSFYAVKTGRLYHLSIFCLSGVREPREAQWRDKSSSSVLGPPPPGGRAQGAGSHLSPAGGTLPFPRQ